MNIPTPSRAVLVALSILTLLVLALSFRYQVVPASEEDICVFRLDRWTGNLRLACGTESWPVKAN